MFALCVFTLWCVASIRHLMWKASATSSRRIWPEIITSRDAQKYLFFQGSRTSCDVIIFGNYWPNFGQKRSHHVMDAFCRSDSFRKSLKTKKDLQWLGNEKCGRTFFAQTFWTPPGVRDTPAKFPGHPRFVSSKPKENKLSREGTNFSATTPSRGRPPPDRTFSGPKKLIFVLFFLAWVVFWLALGWVYSQEQWQRRAKRVRDVLLATKSGKEPFIFQSKGSGPLNLRGHVRPRVMADALRKTWPSMQNRKRPHKQNRAKIHREYQENPIFCVFLADFEGCCVFLSCRGRSLSQQMRAYCLHRNDYNLNSWLLKHVIVNVAIAKLHLHLEFRDAIVIRGFPQELLHLSSSARDLKM